MEQPLRLFCRQLTHGNTGPLCHNIRNIVCIPLQSDNCARRRCDSLFKCCFSGKFVVKFNEICPSNINRSNKACLDVVSKTPD